MASLSEPEAVPFLFASVPAAFASLQSKDAAERLHRWGLKDVIKVERFKFSGRLTDETESDFLNDLICSSELASTMELLSPLPREALADLEVKKIPCGVTNMGFFDALETDGLLAPNGYLRKCANDRVAGVEIDTLVTDLLLLGDDSEYAGSFSSEARAEFLFQLFHLIFIGGAMHQRDEDCLGYLEQTKAMYKDLLTVHKKASTGKVEVTSRVFQVSLAPAAAAKGQGAPLFPGGVPDHSRCFVVVDPVRRYATAVYSNYKSFW